MVSGHYNLVATLPIAFREFKHFINSANAFSIGNIIESSDYGHVNIINSKFSGSITASGGNVGGLIGLDETYSNLFLTNVSVAGSITGAANSGRYVGSMQSSCNTEHRELKIKNATSTSSLPYNQVLEGLNL